MPQDRLLNSLDLFSGIGGITAALEGIARPVGYCEIDKGCQQVLKWHINRGNLPNAPIFDDICKLTKRSFGDGTNIDIIVGGWPCQDLSPLGKRRGLSGERSGLIREVVRVTDEFKPKFLFLENVPQVMASGFDYIVDEFVTKRSYELRWVVIPASSAGAPHVRKRWYGLLIRKDAWALISKMVFMLHSYHPTNWDVRSEPQRMIVPKTLQDKKELLRYVSMLGNSVVPDAVRLAFITMASAYSTPVTRETLRKLKTLQFARFDVNNLAGKIHTLTAKHKLNTNTWGVVTPDKSTFVITKPAMAKPELNLTFDPHAFHKPVSGLVSAKLVETRVSARSWGTPRFTVPMCNVLTQRSIRDLPTQVRFEKSTPNNLREGVIHPAFVEWMMGFTGKRAYLGQVSTRNTNAGIGRWG